MISFTLVNKPEVNDPKGQVTDVMLFYVKDVTVGGLFKMMIRTRLMESGFPQGILEIR